MGNSAIGRGSAVEENKVKASAADATPDFLDGKVGATMRVVADQIEIAASPSVTSLPVSGASPGTPVANTLYKDNVVKGWVNFNGSGVVSIRDSFNVSSITDNNTGNYDVNWDVDFANANYAISGFVALAGQAMLLFDNTNTPLSTGSAGFLTTNSVGSALDAVVITVLAIGDQ